MSYEIIDLTGEDSDNDVIRTPAHETIRSPVIPKREGEQDNIVDLAVVQPEDEPDGSNEVAGNERALEPTIHGEPTAKTEDFSAANLPQTIPIDVPLHAPSQSPEERARTHQELEASLMAGMEAFQRSMIPKSTKPVPSTDLSQQTDVPMSQAPIDSDAESAAAAAEFRKIRQKYERVKKKGSPNVEEEVVFRRAEEREQVRLRLLERKRAFDPAREESNISDDERLFCSDAGSPGPSTHGYQAEPANAPKKLRKTAANKIPPKALERSQQTGLDEVLKKSKKRKGTTKAEDAKGSPRKKDPKSRVSKPKDRVEKEPVQSGKGKKRGKRAKSPDLTNFASLLHNDIVRDAEANVGKEKQPGFTSKNKKDALAELMASIPEEHRKPYLSEKKHLDDACKKFTWKGNGSMHSDGNGLWRLKGMQTSLYHYQLLGVAWMRDREAATVRPFGGLVCDSMGTGKTVQLLANCVDGMPLKNSPSKTTLIVCPSTLCTQWLNEIKKHIEPGLLGEVMLYRAGARVITDDVAKSLSKCGFIITTYNEVLKHYPYTAAPKHLSDPKVIQAWWEEWYALRKGPLFRVNWHRIILDEAHVIKNHEGRISRAVRSLSGRFRWCLTGTPLSNGIEDLYSFFDFLQVKNTGTFETFKRNFCTKSQKDSMERLHSFLRPFLLRRTNADQMFGRPILLLPHLSHQTVALDFSKLEKQIYSIVKARFIQRINEWSLGGQLEKKYHNIFVMLLRLRQICAHVLLVQGALKDLLAAEDLERLWKLTDQESMPEIDRDSSNTLTVLRKMLAKHQAQTPSPAKEGEQVESPEIAEDANDDEDLDTGGLFGGAFKFRKYLRKLRTSGVWDEINSRSMCHKCHEPPEDPHITVPCGHMYCKECLTGMLFEAAQEQETSASCVECGQVFERTEPCKGFGEACFSIDSPALDPQGKKRKDSSADPEGNELSWLSLPGPPLPSTKTRAVKAQLLNWLSESPDTKVIVFTQWLGVVKILSRVCAFEGWDYCTLTGSMTIDARDRSLDNFRDNPEKRVLLASLKTGGLGLNLTSSNKVIIHDPWWNQSVEDQAFSRVWRIGQERDVEVKRFIVNDTVDTQLLLKIQERKNLEIDRAIGEKSQKSNLSVHELVRLFGPVKIDAEGNELVDDKDELDEEFIFVEDQHYAADAEKPEDAIPPYPF